MISFEMLSRNLIVCCVCHHSSEKIIEEEIGFGRKWRKPITPQKTVQLYRPTPQKLYCTEVNIIAVKLCQILPALVSCLLWWAIFPPCFGFCMHAGIGNRRFKFHLIEIVTKWICHFNYYIILVIQSNKPDRTWSWTLFKLVLVLI